MAVVGAAGIPADLQAWGSLFRSLGSEGGRWVLVIAGLAVLLLIQLGPRAWNGRPRTDVADEQEDLPTSTAHGEREQATQDEAMPNQVRPPTPTPLPPVASSATPLPPTTVLSALGDARRDGELLLRAARNPLGGYATFGRQVDDATVRSWEANVKHVLRDDTSRLSLFTYAPLTPGSRFTVALVDNLTGQRRTKRLERRLGQLDKVIESY
jgi:hypothetical protein